MAVAVVMAFVVAVVVAACSSSPPKPSDTSPAAPPVAETPTATPAPATLAPTTTVTTTPTPISAGVPAYFSPSPLWDVMLGTANTGDARVSLAVMNPANGPGPALDSGYARVIGQAKAKGVRVLGYVATGYGTRASVLADIDAYKRFYGLTDIFLDESTTDCVSLATYLPWVAAVHANGGLAAVNPGMVPASCWGTAADLIVTFEGPFDAYLHYERPPWMDDLPASSFWNIVYAVPAGSAPFVRELAGRHHTGLLYATEDGLPNPYDSLPAALSIVTVPPPTAAPITAPPITIPPVIVGGPAATAGPATPVVVSPSSTLPLIIVLTPATSVPPP